MDAPQSLVDIVYAYHEQNIAVHSAKFRDEDVTREPELADIAKEYLENYTGNFAFLTDMKAKTRGSPSVGQIRGILNTMLAEANRTKFPITNVKFDGLAPIGFYASPNFPILEVRKWREDGTALLLEQHPMTHEWTAFASINPDFTYRLWGRTNTPHYRAIADEFFAPGADRGAWNEFFTTLTGKCYVCGRNPVPENAEIGLCESCSLGGPPPEENAP